MAHSWTKETVGWVQQVAKHTDGSCSSELNDVLRIADVRIAAGSFKAVTSVTDGFHSRHFQLLLDEALKLLYAAEGLCDMPCAQRSFIVAMLSKPTGGSGPGCIGLFLVWTNARRHCVQAWQNSRGDHPACAGSCGRTAVDTVWRQVVRGQNTMQGTMRASRSCRTTANALRWSLTCNCGSHHPLSILRLSFQS